MAYTVARSGPAALSTLSLGAVVTGDLGTSFLYKEPVSKVMARALPPTLLLAGSGLLPA